MFPPLRLPGEQQLREEGGRTAGIVARKDQAMGLLSCVGRVLFGSMFLLSAYRVSIKSS
jgi:hypothetical protein